MKKLLLKFYKKFTPKRLRPIIKKKIISSKILSKLLLRNNKASLSQFNNFFNYISSQQLIKKIEKYEVISFDIFDTLITRKIASPDYLFDYIDFKVSNICHLKNGRYKEARITAENMCRTFNHDCNINEIYDKMSEILKLDARTIKKIKSIEIDTDTDLTIPRYEMMRVFERAKSMHKKIILISDMYYTKDILENILKKNGYSKYDEIFISCEINARKDTGKLWEYIFGIYKEKFIHIGDNVNSDGNQLKRFKKDFVLIPSPESKFQNSFFANNWIKNLDNALMIGLIENSKLVNSPFQDVNENNLPSNFNLQSYGYSVLGPLFLYYCIWLHKIKEKKTILFVSREGYYLKKIYEYIYEISKSKDILNDKYLLISRRSITVANIKNVDDIQKILKTDYTGTIGECLYYRFGIQTTNTTKIILPNNIKEVMNTCEKYHNQIFENAKNERSEFIRYLNSLNIRNFENTIIADLGYSGTAQYELCKLLNKKIDGAYFVVSDNVKPLKLGANVHSCFNSLNQNDIDFRILGPNSQFLEAFLTSPNGQLVKFLDGKPIYLKEAGKDKLIKQLDKIYEGVISFIHEYNQLSPKNIYDINLDKQFIINNYASFANFFNTHIMPKEFLDTFKFENYYSFNYEYLISKRN